MMTKSLMILMFCFIFLAVNKPATATEQQVSFHIFSSASPKSGIKAEIVVVYPGNEKDVFVTDDNGQLTADLKSCDARVVVEAKSFWGGFTKVVSNCDPIPVRIALIPAAQTVVVERVLTKAVQNSYENYVPGFGYQLANLSEAVIDGDLAKAAAAANEAQWALFVAGHSKESYELGVFAQSVGFQAIAKTGLLQDEITSTDSTQMNVDPERGLVVMSEQGKFYLKRAQRELGLEANGIWGPETFGAIAKANR